MKKTNTHRNRRRKEAGYTLLEYAAGAAVLLTVVLVGLNSMGTNLSGMFNSIGQWATDNQQFQGVGAGTGTGTGSGTGTGAGTGSTN